MKLRRWNGIDVQEALALEMAGDDKFLTAFAQRNRFGTIFGGQFMGVALEAASRTVEKKTAHAVSGYFLRRGDVETPLEIAVERSFDGTSYCARRVVCSQKGQPVFHLEASFKTEEPSVAHAQLPSAGGNPETLERLQDLLPRYRSRISDGLAMRLDTPPSIDLRPIDPDLFILGRPDRFHRAAWISAPSAQGAAQATQRSILAYLTDYLLAGTAAIPHEAPDRTSDYFMASLNQSMWFCAPVFADQWLLAECSSPMVGSGRGIGRADIYNRAGQLVACATQEVLIRDSRP